ncbi:MAG: Lrp/AsnC family transcriptional regulator [Asticcacaulis sp.]|uniref:Lrp/AsnC family transcriptional regulator n=1 Tax=Asticcacaulis sp. TaxID=1872648 RepID=UPI0039E2E06E
MSISNQKLDDFDIAILRCLQDNAARPQREIAAQVNLSPAAVQRRIARMEAEGVIRGSTVLVDPAKVGFAITLIVEATLVNDRSATVARVKAMFREAGEVQQCYRVAGTAGLIVILLVPSMEVYEARTARLFADNELVQAYRTIVVLDRIKTGLQVPL